MPDTPDLKGTSHTPGPWEAEKPMWTDPRSTRHITDGNRRLIARVAFANAHQSENEAVANARLIAAAPTMADAIRAAAKDAVILSRELHGYVAIPRALYDALENALDAATGEYTAAGAP